MNTFFIQVADFALSFQCITQVGLLLFSGYQLCLLRLCFRLEFLALILQVKVTLSQLIVTRS